MLGFFNSTVLPEADNQENETSKSWLFPELLTNLRSIFFTSTGVNKLMAQNPL
jgi:hypothetical protein